MEKEKEREEEYDRLMSMDERKRPYHSMKAEGSSFPTEEELEAYHRRKSRKDDPMNDFM